MKKTLLDRLKENIQLRRRSGPLTERLVQEPGKFGLGRVPQKVRPDGMAKSICGFCSTGCSLNLHLKEGEAVNLTPSVQYPVNMGMACPKGWEALSPLAATDRATAPLLRNEAGAFEEVSWDKALAVFTQRLKKIQAEHGDESVAFLSTGQIVSEEMAFLGALAKFGMGIVHGDGNTRQCMATAVAAYKQSFGFDAPPYTYADFELSDVLVFVGANPCIAHPIMWQRVMRNRNQPAILVVDPRTTETAMTATRHYAPRPKSDLVLFYGIARILLERGAVNREFVEKHTNGFDEFCAFLADYPVERIASETGLSVEQIEEFAGYIQQGKRVSFWWTMGVNQSYEGTRLAQALINLALMTGNIGRPGTGANSITGQCNAMGSRLFSNTTNLLGGHRFESEEDRNKVAGVLGIDAAKIPAQTGWAYDQIVEGIESGAIRGLWVIATNPAHSWIHQGRFRKLRAKLDFLVVQDMYYSTDTARIADLVLPAAGWGEKDGTFINSERRFGRVSKVSRAPGAALADFHIFQLIAQSWGCADLFAQWTEPEAVFQLLKGVTAGQPCDISGIRDYAHLDERGGIQWPCANADDAEVQERRLFEDGKFCFADERARFCFSAPQSIPEPPDEQYPVLLMTGRGTSSQWHTQTRTAKSDVLRKLYPQEAYIEINPTDAGKLGIGMGDDVQVISRRGAVVVKAFVAGTVSSGQAFMPMHYEETNYLTHASFDPHSRQPSYKCSAVRICRNDIYH